MNKLAAPLIAGALCVLSPAHAVAQAIVPQTGYWWNAFEPGRGFFLEIQGNTMLVGGFLYDSDGRATWVASTGPMATPTMYTGQLITYAGGQTLGGPYQPPNQSAVSPGNIAINFLSDTTATLTWPGGTVPIDRYAFGPTGMQPVVLPVVPQTGWWWNPQESGRGFAVEVQNTALYLAGYMYDGNGNPIWYVSSNATGIGDQYGRTQFLGNWAQYRSGQTLTGSYIAPMLVNSNVAAVNFTVDNSSLGTLSMPNSPNPIQISRYIFGGAATYTSPPPPLNRSVTYQMDYGHTGWASFGGAPLTFPSAPTWSKTFTGTVSYPLFANGRVYVLEASPIGNQVSLNLWALDETSGVPLLPEITVSSTQRGGGLAYDNDRIFVSTADGIVRAYDPATGNLEWSISTTSGFGATPTAANGIVYIDGTYVSAVDETNGNVLWSSFTNGSSNAPAVSSDGVFVSYPCQVYKFDPRTGTRLWFHDGGCEGGGGDTPVYSNGLVYVRDLGLSGPDQGEVFDAESGKQVHAFPGLASYTRAPAISNQYAYFSSQTSGLMGTGSLDCRALGTLFLVWSFTGDGNIVSPPLVIDQTVFVGSSSGNVYALDGAAGTLLWTGNAGGKINGFDDYPGQPLAGFGAGDGYLVVPAANVLTAWKLTSP